MNQKFEIRLCTVAAIGLSGLFGSEYTLAASMQAPVAAATAKQAQAAGKFGQLPISFEANQGQTDSQVRFLSRGPGYSLFLTPGEAVLSLRTSGKGEADAGNLGSLRKPEAATDSQGAVVRLSFDGANRNPTLVGQDRGTGTSNYFLGKDAGQWHRDLPNFGKVRYQNLYSGVDLLYYGNQTQLEYDLIVAAGADPSPITLNVAGVDGMHVNQHGDLVLDTTSGQLVQHAPIAFQDVAGKRIPVSAHYTLLGGNRVGFRLGAYDRSQTLVIDPVLVYSTYLGGTLGDRATDVYVDTSKNAYVTGFSNSAAFPTKGAYSSTNKGAGEVFVTKLSPTGALLYSTYIGGSGSDEAAGITVDGSGNAYVTGRTTSIDYPTVSAFQTTLGGVQDAFVTKLNATGNGLVYSTYLGGNANTTSSVATGEYGYGIAVDANGSAYVSGWTASTNFPTVNPIQASRSASPAGCDPAVDVNKCARSEVFVSKFAANGASLIYSTYLGGTEYDESYSLALDSSSNVYVTGTTSSAAFPTVTPKQITNAGNGDSFVTKINAAGSALVYSTYLGGVGQDLGYGIAVGGDGSAYVVGVTASSNFPSLTPAQAFNGGAGGSATDGFITKVAVDGKSWGYSTWIGGAGADSANGVAVDSSGTAYIAGQTSSTTNFPISNAFQSTQAGMSDAFLVKLAGSGSAFVYGTYIGGSGDDFGNEVAIDSAGDAYIVGYSASSNFPVLNAAQATNAGSQDAFVSRLTTVSDPTLSVNDISLAEGNAGTSTMTFTVTLSKVLTSAVTFNIGTGGGTATAGNDYVVTSLTGQTIAAGATTKTFTVTINGDTTVESDETFFVNLSAVSGALIGDGQGQGTILNDDQAAPLTLSIADVSVTEGNSGTTTATFTVTQSGVSTTNTTFNIATADGTAVAGSDYVANSATGLSIPAGSTTKTFAVTINGDTATEPNEFFYVNVSNAVGATIADGQAQGNINNDDTAPLPTLSVADVSITEGNSGTSLLTFTVTLSAVAQTDAKFDVFTSNNTAAAGSDYVALNLAGQIIPVGSSNKTFSVTINGDTTLESNETFFLNISNVTGATVADGQALGTILNDDTAPLPAISVADVRLTEGNSGTVLATFTVQLSAVPANTVTFDVATANGTATAGTDYLSLALAGQSIAAGVTSKDFNVSINGDTLVEADETFNFNVTNAANATISDGTGVGTILNDDVAPPPTISVADVSVTEGNSGTSLATFTVQLSAASANAVGFDVATANGTAASGSDYVALALAGQSIAAGLTSKTFSVTINGDTLFETDETFSFNVTNASNATISNGSAIGTILNDDVAPLPTLSVADVRVTEGNSGTVLATFTVQLSAASASAVNFNVATANGTATAGSDYVALALTGQSIAAGLTSKTFSVTVNGDVFVEGDETFNFNVTNAANATISDGVAIGTIVNDDITGTAPPTISVNDVTMVEGNSGNKSMTFTVSLSAAAANPVTFDINTSNGTAFAGSDYVQNILTGQSIPAGQTSYSFSVSITPDSQVEANETFTVNLNNVTEATLLDGQGLGVITNDDIATVSVAPTSVTEGNSGLTTAIFTITLSVPMPTPVTFDITTGNGTAIAGSDYQAQTALSVLIDAGRTRATFEVQVIGDTVTEADETFKVTISNVSGASLGTAIANGTIVNDDLAAMTISQIQGTAQLSPVANQDVSTEGVVTALTGEGFYLQSAETEQDSDARTSEGIYVVGMSGAQLAVGDRVKVAGLVREALVGTGSEQLTQTQVVANKVDTLARGQALPRAISLDAATVVADPSVAGLERFEGMRVSVPELVVVAASGGTVNEATGQVSGNGKFYGVARGINRPFLEPGLNVLARAQAVAGVSPQQFDANPERLLIDSAGQRGSHALSTDAGDTLRGLVGVLGYGSGSFRLLPDTNASIAVTSGAAPKPVSAARTGEATIASFQLRRFFDDSRAAGEPVLNASAYGTRLAKTANAICAYARTPDILGLSGLENRTVLGDIAAATNAKDGNLLFAGSCATSSSYQAALPAGANGQLGFLVNTAQVRPGVARVEVISTSQAANARFNQRDGSNEALFEQAPMFLEARINEANGRSSTVTVLSVQMSALQGDLEARGNHGWASRGSYLRARRSAQARSIAMLVQSRQSARPNEKLVVLGDFESAQFNDGYSDLLGTVSGHSAPRAKLLGYVDSPVTAALTNLTTRLPAGQRYTVVREGNAQAVDHILVNAALLQSSPAVRAEVARINADFGEDNYGDANVPVRVSDHDPVVMYLDLN